MRTKEEIFNDYSNKVGKWYQHSFPYGWKEYFTEDELLKIMDEYADERCIELMDYLKSKYHLDVKPLENKVDTIESVLDNLIETIGKAESFEHLKYLIKNWKP